MRGSSIAVALAAILAANPALAGKGAVKPAQCSAGDISVAALSCSGFVAGNLISSSPSDIKAQKDALSALGLTNWNGTAVASFQNLKGATTISFAQELTGLTYIGVHYGNGKGGPGNATAFYMLDAAKGLNQLHLAFAASSNFVVYATGLPDGHETGDVPEPASWALMVGGFGLVGGAMRIRRKSAITFA